MLVMNFQCIHSSPISLPESVPFLRSIPEQKTQTIPAPCNGYLLQHMQWLVNELLKPKCDDPVYSLHTDPFCTWHSLYRLRNVIICQRWENGPQIITHWKLWLPRFIVTGCKNYSVECVHLLTNLCADLYRNTCPTLPSITEQ